jgi:hypothetical protein
MDRERNRKYTTSTPRNKRYLSTEPIRSNYLNTPNGELLHKPSADIIENKVPVNNATAQKENHKSSVVKSNHYSDFPLPTKKRPKLPKIKVNLTYKKIMLSLAVLLLITLVANLALFYNYQKNHPAQAKIVLQEDTGKGIEIDDYSAYDKTPVTANFINSYKTEKDLPKLLQIQKINLNSRIKIVSSDSGGSIKVPKNINDVGWYEGSSKPGDRGVVFLDGTSSYDGAQGAYSLI